MSQCVHGLERAQCAICLGLPEHFSEENVAKTEPIRQLMEMVLPTVQRDEDVIDKVFCAIEAEPNWRRQYDDLCDEFGKHVVNTMGGYWIAQAVGGFGRLQVSAKSSLIESYSKLDLR